MTKFKTIRNVAAASLALATASTCLAQPSVTLTQDTVIGPGDYDGYAVHVLGCTVTMSGTHSFAYLWLESSAQAGARVAGFYNSEQQVTLNIANDLRITSGAYSSGIDFSERGHAGSFGPGAGAYTAFATHASGGGHGGTGADSFAPVALGGQPYGSETQPTTFGSGGGGDANGNFGGWGGGAIRIIAGGAVRFDNGAYIVANGGAGLGSDAGGGAGGSIWISAASIEGFGFIEASGGSSCCPYAGGGGGGRIRLESCSAPSASVFLTNSSGSGGNGGAGGTVSVGEAAGVPAAILQHPLSVRAAEGTYATFQVFASSPTAMTYQWYRTGSTAVVDDGKFRGATTSALTIYPVHFSIIPGLSDEGSYSCLVTNSCGVVSTVSATLSSDSICPSDLDDGSGSGTPDNGTDINDLLYFLEHFEVGC